MKMDYGNSARGLKDLSAEQQALLVGWIRDVLVRAQSVFARNSYAPLGRRIYPCRSNFSQARLPGGHPSGRLGVGQGRSHHPRRAPFWPVRELPTDSAPPAERGCHVPRSPFFVTV
jgi:hypothetical protein